MESPRLSARAVIYSEDRILLSKYEDDRGYWYITPGGGIRKGETLSQGLKREVLEEVGAVIDVGETVAIREVMALPEDEPYLPANFHQMEVFFSCNFLELVSQPQEFDPGQIGFEWVPLTELQNKLFFPETFKLNLIQRHFPKIYFGNIR